MANYNSSSFKYVMEIDNDNIKETTEESIERLRYMAAGENVACRRLNNPMSRFEPKFNDEIKAVIDNYLESPLEFSEKYNSINRFDQDKLVEQITKFNKRFGDVDFFPPSSYDFASTPNDSNIVKEFADDNTSNQKGAFSATITNLSPYRFASNNNLDVDNNTGVWERVKLNEHHSKFIANDPSNTTHYATSPRVLATFPGDDKSIDDQFNAMDLNSVSMMEEVD